MQETTLQKEIIHLDKVESYCSRKCEYCNSQAYTAKSWELIKSEVHPTTFQLLLERGWVRCGDFYYKKDNCTTCCPYWMQRLNVNQFKIKKDQKKTIRKVWEGLIGDFEKNEEKKQLKRCKNKQNSIKDNLIQVTEEAEAIMKKTAFKLNHRIQESLKNFWALIGLENFVDQSARDQLVLDPVIQKLKFFTSKPEEKSTCYCNYGMLLFGLNKKIFRKQFTALDFVVAIRSFIEEQGQKDEDFKLELERSGYLLFFSSKENMCLQKKIMKIKDQKLGVMTKKQNQIPIIQQVINEQAEFREKGIKFSEKKKEDEIGKSVKKQTDVKNMKLRITSKEITFGKLKIKFVPVEFSEESYKMYQEHSREVHNIKDMTRARYSDFLCTKGMIQDFKSNSSPSNKKYLPAWIRPQNPELGDSITGIRVKPMGCFHMKYFLEDVMIAVGVADIFPEGFSSNYFFHDMKYRGLRLGVFSTLIEIQYVRWMQLSFPEFRFYSMGSYIQNSSKMLYKVTYEPCELLCPITHQFVKFTPEVKEKIEKIKNNETDDASIASLETQIHEDMRISSRQVVDFIQNNISLILDDSIIEYSELIPDHKSKIIRDFFFFLPQIGKSLFNRLLIQLPNSFKKFETIISGNQQKKDENVSQFQFSESGEF